MYDTEGHTKKNILTEAMARSNSLLGISAVYGDYKKT